MDIQDQIRWAEAFVIIYSLIDRHSFKSAQEFLRIIKRARASVYAPIILVGNKRDLELGRQVDLKEGRTIALQFGCQFYEVSFARRGETENISASCSTFRLISQAIRLNI